MLDAIRESLAIDFRVLVLNAAAFLILLALLDRIFWKPIMRHMNNRRANIEETYKAIDATRQEMEALRSEYERQLDAIEAQARARIQETLKAAHKARDDAIADARAKAEQIMQEGAARIAAERLAALQAAEARLERAAAEALGRAQGSPPDEQQRELIREFIRSRAKRN